MHIKKIIIIGPAHPLRGGIADSNHSLAAALQQLGHHVEFLSFSLQYPSILFPGKSQFDYDAIPPKIKIKSAINSINPISWINCAIWLRKQKPDIIISRYWIPFIGISIGSVLRISGLKSKSTLVALCDNIIPHEKRIGDSLLTKFFLKSNDYYFVMSKAVGDDINKFIDKPKIDFHPHPVYDQFGLLKAKVEAKQILGLDNSKKYILFFGFIRAYKGLDLLINAMPHIDNDVHLIVAGEFYDDHTPYLSLIDNLNLNSRIHLFSEFIPQSDVTNYFSACDMVVQPYKSATQSGVAQIAYHFNKPIIVTDVGGLAEVVPHNKVGYVVDVDSMAISNAVNRFYFENNESRFSENISIEKEKYSWINMAKQLVKNY